MTASGLVHSQGSLFGQPRATAFLDGDLSVEVADRDAANSYIRAHHYSGTVCMNSVDHFAVGVGGRLVGFLQFGYAMNPSSGGGILPGLAKGEWCELNRMHLSDEAPRYTESRAISACIKILRHNNRRLRLIQSFADERCGGFGVVYQACSFLYLGEHTSTFWELDGTWFHNIAATVRGDELNRRKSAALLQANIARATRHEIRQFRYVKVFRPSDAKALAPRVKPYPKRQPPAMEAM